MAGRVTRAVMRCNRKSGSVAGSGGNTGLHKILILKDHTFAIRLYTITPVVYDIPCRRPKNGETAGVIVSHRHCFVEVEHAGQAAN